jgi:hypothetical protein
MHPDAIIIVDEAAASKLKRKDYYKHVNRLLEEQGL